VKILYVCHRFPYPPRRGGTIRPFNMIRHLSQSHEVVVCSITRSDQMTRDAQGIAEHCSRFYIGQVDERVQALRMLATVPTPFTASESFFYSGSLKRRIRRLLAQEQFDLIFVHCSSVAHYVAHVRGIPKILDYGDMDSQKWLEFAQHKPFPLSIAHWWEGTRVAALERSLARHFDFCTTITRAEHDTLLGHGIDTPSDWFPNGVDNEFFAPVEAVEYDPDSIVFIGRMDYYPNQQAMLDFCANVFPLLKAKRPSIKLQIVGALPPPSIVALGKIPGVSVTGTVPDVRPYVTRAALTVAPLRIARGTQNKILEAMAMGTPVVASVLASRGVDAVAGQHLLAADTPQDMCAAILSVLDDPQLRARLSQAGRARVLSHHAWPSSMKRLDAVIERCLARWSHPSSLASQSQAQTP
jgi:sugar transferase (PEP-CTERM/EpsH1 system associated)